MKSCEFECPYFRNHPIDKKCPAEAGQIAEQAIENCAKLVAAHESSQATNLEAWNSARISERLGQQTLGSARSTYLERIMDQENMDQESPKSN